MTPTSQAELAYTDEGQGEPVVLLHAFPLDRRMWRTERDELAASYRVIAPDLAGFGKSLGLPTRASLDAHAGDVARLLDALGIERATLVGMSMGGYIALAFAARHSERLSGLALADTKATPDTPEGKLARDANIALVASHGAPALLDRLLPKLLSPGASNEVVEGVKSIGISQAPASLSAALAAMRDRADTSPVLPELDVPTAVIVGEADVITPVADARALVAALPQATLEVIPGAGHLANLEAPRAFGAALSRLLRKIAS